MAVIQIFAVIIGLAGPLIYRFRSLLPLLTSQELDTILLFSPNELAVGDVIFLLLSFFAKSLVSPITRLARGVTTTSKDDSAITLTVAMPLKITERDVKQYRKAVRKVEEDNINWTNPDLTLFLCALTFPSLILLLAKAACPMQPLGAVNVRNRFELLKPELCYPSKLSRPGGGASILATIKSPGRVAKRGIEYDIEVRIDVPDENQNGYVTAFRQVLTMLQFSKSSGAKAEASKQSQQQTDLGHQTIMQALPLDFAAPSKWATCCKDYNPIHISKTLAKLYGMPGKVAHGNHVAALTMAKLEEAGPLIPQDCTPFWMEVNFKRPVVVPAELTVTGLEFAKADHTKAFRVEQRSKVCVDGSYGKL